MGIFKLPVISIGGKRGEPARPAPRTFDPAQPSPRDRATPDAPPAVPGIGEGTGSGGARVSIDIPRGQGAVGTRVKRDEGGRISGAPRGAVYTDIPTMFLDNAKEVIARCIQAGLIGDAAARDYFRSYSAYLEQEPGGGYQDFLTYAFNANEEQLTQIASILNSSLDYPLARLEVEPGKVSGGLVGVLEGDLRNFCLRVRVPALAASTSDLLVLGVANPYLVRHVEAAFRAELPELENSYRFYLLLTPGQLATALERAGRGSATEGAEKVGDPESIGEPLEGAVEGEAQGQGVVEVE